MVVVLVYHHLQQWLRHILWQMCSFLFQCRFFDSEYASSLFTLFLDSVRRCITSFKNLLNKLQNCLVHLRYEKIEPIWQISCLLACYCVNIPNALEVLGDNPTKHLYDILVAVQSLNHVRNVFQSRDRNMTQPRNIYIMIYN